MSERHSPARSGIPARVGDVLLWIASAAGAVCALFVVLAVVFDVTLIMFKTGSMSPTIPAGSVALVHEIPASEARVGDVLTVDRPGQLPITHRVTGIEPAGDAGTTTRSITMKGDANEAEDPAPYVVDRVRLVLGSVPHLATVVVGLSNPYLLGGITLSAAVLVTWAFWPRGAEADRQTQGGRRGRRRPLTITLALAVGMTGLGAGALLPSVPAAAAPAEEVTSSRFFQLTSVADAESMGHLVPGKPVAWQVGIVSAAPEPADIRVGISGSGALVRDDELMVHVRACAERFIDGDCAAGHSEWLPHTPVAEATRPASAGELGMRELATLPAVSEQWLLITAQLDPTAAPGESADLRVHVVGSGDDASAGPPGGSDGGVGAGDEGAGDEGAGEPGAPWRGALPGGLALSGVDGLALAALAAVGAIGLGLGIAAFAAERRRRRSHD